MDDTLIVPRYWGSRFRAISISDLMFCEEHLQITSIAGERITGTNAFASLSRSPLIGVLEPGFIKICNIWVARIFIAVLLWWRLPKGDCVLQQKFQLNPVAVEDLGSQVCTLWMSKRSQNFWFLTAALCECQLLAVAAKTQSPALFRFWGSLWNIERSLATNGDKPSCQVLMRNFARPGC